ncbi:MAG TPA: BtaA family protein [Saprospiraceae bacterium]|nr:BtaA family protein [Saprospiraceae bacterium]
MVNTIKTKVFQKIHGSNLVYNTCWEDPRCDRALLDFDKESQIVMLTSAGCNALDYLLDDPKSIDCIDMNPRQNGLLELKCRMIQHADYQSLFEWFGQGFSQQAATLFHKTLAKQLSDFSRKYWHKHLYFFTGEKLRKRFYWYGSAGAAAYLLHKRIKAKKSLRNNMHALQRAQNLEEQKAIYEQLEPLLLDAFTAWLINRHIFQSMLGVPQIQQNLAKENYPDGMAGYVRACLRSVFTQQSLADNYFWRVYLNGHYSEECCPNYLKQENYDLLKSRVNRIQTHTFTLSDFLQQNPGKYTHFILLDHQDWMAENNIAALEEEWQLILQNSAPGAKYLLRSASASVHFIPMFVHEKVTFLSADSIPNIPSDRVGTYATTLRGILKQPQ